jgi:hypothetical protein
MTLPDVIIVVSGGNVQVVYAPSETRIQIVDFDNLEEGDPFDLQTCTPPDGPPNGAAALGVLAEALELAARNGSAPADDGQPAAESPKSRRYYVEDDDGRRYGPFDEHEDAASVADAIHGRIIAQPVERRPDAGPA